ncbi:MAG: 5'-methylthioadenosine/S-adenosylhomocysteine nucleosidase [Anaerolineaceae bacterium]|jgi:adenosylhomocysteine nucleosidase
MAIILQPGAQKMNLVEPVVVVIISANGEWRVALDLLRPEQVQRTPYGEWFRHPIENRPLIFMYGGWGKISAAATAQYAIDIWQPDLLINLGTCGGFAGAIERDTIVLVEQTLVYDIIEQMSDANAAIEFFSTQLDLSWLKQPYPQPVLRTRLVSADRDILAQDIPHLQQRFGAVAADWESGAIAWVCHHNGVRCLILRGVTDLVGAAGGEAYGNVEVFHSGARRVMSDLLAALPGWLQCAL